MRANRSGASSNGRAAAYATAAAASASWAARSHQRSAPCTAASQAIGQRLAPRAPAEAGRVGSERQAEADRQLSPIEAVVRDAHGRGALIGHVGEAEGAQEVEWQPLRRGVGRER